MNLCKKAQNWGLIAGVFLAALGACTVESSPPTAVQTHQGEAVGISVKYTFYEIVGNSAEELGSQLEQLGVVDESGERYSGYTEWEITWSYPYERKDGLCAAGPVTASLEIEITLPQWKPPADAPQALISRWEDYSQNLKTHEEGHQVIAVNAANQIYTDLSEIHAFSTCEALEQAADALGENLLAEFREQEGEYDAETNHGATQGAQFP